MPWGGLVELHGVTVLAVDPTGPELASGGDATDLVGEAHGTGAELVAVPAARLAADFFRLRTGLAGEVVEKFVNYRLRLAVVGDIAGHIAGSTALRDFVTESNRGAQLWFVASLDDLAERLRP